MACLLQRITSMKLQNNWYVWQISLHLYIIFLPHGTYSCEACTESLHLSRLAATVFAKKKKSPPPPRANVDKERMIKPFKRASVCMGGYWELCFESELETGLMLLLWS